MDNFSLFLEKKLEENTENSLQRLDEATKKMIGLSKSLDKIETIKKDFDILKQLNVLFKEFSMFSKLKPSTASELTTVMKKRNDISYLIANIASAGTRILKQNKIPDVENIMDILGDIAKTTQQLFRKHTVSIRN